MTKSLPLLLVYALAVLRLTRLLVHDTILASFRDWVGEKAHVGKVLASGTPSRADRWWSKIWNLIGCSWCVSFWVSIPVTVLARFEGSWWSWVCAALALSGVTGFLAEKT